jgi:hypothetical protein
MLLIGLACLRHHAQRRACLMANSSAVRGAGRPGREHPMNWSKIARCTAVAIGTTFVAVAAAFLAVRLFGLVL